jgi:ParB family chromosome partitioning protein
MSGRKVLGRGLSALIGGDQSVSVSKGEELLDLDIDQVRPNPEQPRTRFTEEAIEELAASIRANGVVQPILVRRSGLGYEIVAGERRWRAAQRAELKKIPVVVKEISDDRILEIALVENIQRQELNPVEEARAFRKLIDNIGLTQEELSDRIGKSRTVIATYLRFLKLPDDVQKLLEEEKISAGHARALLMTEDFAVQRSVAKSVVDDGLSVRDTEKAVKRGGVGGVGSQKKSRVKPTLDPNFKLAETKMRRHLGTNVHIIPDGKGTGGKVEIEYYSETDLDRIYNLILKQ